MCVWRGWRLDGRCSPTEEKKVYAEEGRFCDTTDIQEGLDGRQEGILFFKAPWGSALAHQKKKKGN